MSHDDTGDGCAIGVLVGLCIVALGFLAAAVTYQAGWW